VTASRAQGFERRAQQARGSAAVGEEPALGHHPAAHDHPRDVRRCRGERQLRQPGARRAGRRRIDLDQVSRRADGQPARRAKPTVAAGRARGVQLGGGEPAAAAGGQALAGLERSKLKERVDHGVLVAAERQRRPGIGERTGRADAVAEIGLGGRAEHRRHAGLAEQGDVLAGEVRRVHDAEPGR